MTQEQYVTFEIAVLLEEKGFVWQTEKYISKNLPQLANFVQAQNSAIKYYACPSQEVAMRWLRKSHNINISVEPCVSKNGFSWEYKIVKYVCHKSQFHCASYYRIDLEKRTYGFNLPEDAVESAIMYCLEKLI